MASDLYLNIEDHGAVAEDENFDNSSIVQSCIDLADGKLPVLIPPKRFFLGDTVDAGRRGTKIIGMGAHLSGFKAMPGMETKAMLKTNDIPANGPEASQQTTAQFVHLEGFFVGGEFGVGIQLQKAPNAQVKDIKIGADGAHAKVNKYAFFFGDSFSSSFSDLTTHGADLTASEAAFYFGSNMQSISCSNFRTSNAGAPIGVLVDRPTYGADAMQILFTSLELQGFEKGVYLPSNCDAISFQGGWCELNGTDFVVGRRASPRGIPRGVSISGFNFLGEADHPSFTDQYHHTAQIWLEMGSDFDITGNRFGVGGGECHIVTDTIGRVNLDVNYYERQNVGAFYLGDIIRRVSNPLNIVPMFTGAFQNYNGPATGHMFGGKGLNNQIYFRRYDNGQGFTEKVDIPILGS